MMYNWHGEGFFGYGGWIGLVFMVLFWLAIIVLVVWAVSALISISRRGAPPPSSGPREDSALRILRERYARGEIDTDQFEQARRTLEGGGHSPA